jgi:hypothetical protein
MKPAGRFVALIALLLALAIPVEAKEFYVSYNEGLDAVRSRNWDAVVQKMNEAISKNPKEGRRTRTYGNIFIAYHPYYYRGVASFSLGRFDQAISDLQRATGIGAEDLGSIDSFIARAETRMALAQPAPQEPAPTPVQPPAQAPSQPAAQPAPQPSPTAVDPALAPARRAAEARLAEAEKKQGEARGARAETYAGKEFADAQKSLLSARSASASADAAAQWNDVARTADRAARQFELAITRARMSLASRESASASAAEAVVADTRSRVRQALEHYFEGEFALSAREFESLTKSDANNAMLWAFLGASQYYSYYLGGEVNGEARAAAERAFRKARQLKRNLELEPRYFSPRVRNFYQRIE